MSDRPAKCIEATNFLFWWNVALTAFVALMVVAGFARDLAINSIGEKLNAIEAKGSP